MDYLYILFLIVVPASVFFGGFLMARQLRTMANAPGISMIFVQRRFLISVFMGFLASLVFSAILSLVTKFSVLSVFVFILLFLLATLGFYYGVTLGWGNAKSSNKSLTTTNEVQADSAFPENVLVEDSLASVKITINSKKRWGWFVISLFQWLLVGLCGLPLLGLFIISMLQNYLPDNMHLLIWLVIGGFVIFLLYTKFQEVLEYIFDKEIIEVDNSSVKVMKYGSIFKSEKEYPAENIKRITTIFPLGGKGAATRSSPFFNLYMPALMIWHNRGLKRYCMLGRALDLADAQSILENVYSRFPQYKG